MTRALWYRKQVPSVPVEITGLAEVPSAGDTFDAVEDERLAKTLVEQRKHVAKQAKFNAYQKVTLDNLFSQIAEGRDEGTGDCRKGRRTGFC